MARRPNRPTTEPGPAVEGTDPVDPVVRRAPFSDNPVVGARGQRTQQRILDAALDVFGEEGYHRASVERITRRAGCSRASFYQYFSSKEHVFQQLTGHVARQLRQATEALGPLGPDADGWEALRGWVARYAEIQHRYESVFHVFQAASETDAAVATGSARWGDRTRAQLRERLEHTLAPSDQLDATILLLHTALSRTLEMAQMLSPPDAGPEAQDPTVEALADVVHRTFFGRIDDVNVHVPATPPVPATITFDPALRSALDGTEGSQLTAAGRQTMTRLMDAGRTVFVTRGYHDTRVDDVVQAAGVSHGAFYRYFDSKQQLARTLAAGAMTSVSHVLAEIPATARRPGLVGSDDLRSWLRRYNTIQAEQTAMLRVWTDAALQDSTLRTSSAPALEWGRRSMERFLAPRGFGDVHHDATVMVGLLSIFGSSRRGDAEVEAAALIIERGLLGHPV